ncbi:MAG: hypothetical protein AAGB46_19815 [Verrucomicrobiota bacterium]
MKTKTVSSVLLLVALSCGCAVQVTGAPGGKSNRYMESHKGASGKPLAFKAESEGAMFATALNSLEFYMRAGVEKDVGRGAQLLSSYYVNVDRAMQDTRRLYRDKGDLFSSYVSIASDVYGYEFNNDRFGPSVDIEGGIETEDGLMAEYSASLVFRDNKWLIWSLDID